MICLKGLLHQTCRNCGRIERRPPQKPHACRSQGPKTHGRDILIGFLTFAHLVVKSGWFAGTDTDRYKQMMEYDEV